MSDKEHKEVDNTKIDALIEKLNSGEESWDNVCECCQEKIFDREIELAFDKAYDAAGRLCCAKINHTINYAEDIIEELQELTDDMLEQAEHIEAENLKFEENDKEDKELN